ncbi:MAG: TusE/DsrC/DsvC family sulfur relay protein [Bermanella sp.]
MMNTAEFDDEGFLINLDSWDEKLATQIAKNENITLSPAHLEIIHTLRTFYREHEVALANRPFVKLIKNTYGPDKGNSIYLMTLFPESPAKIAAKIAGLPKPANCL